MVSPTCMVRFSAFSTMPDTTTSLLADKLPYWAVTVTRPGWPLVRFTVAPPV